MTSFIIAAKGQLILIFLVETMMMILMFTALSTLFKSYHDDGRVIMKGSEQKSALQS